MDWSESVATQTLSCLANAAIPEALCPSDKRLACQRLHPRETEAVWRLPCRQAAANRIAHPFCVTARPHPAKQQHLSSVALVSSMSFSNRAIVVRLRGELRNRSRRLCPGCATAVSRLLPRFGPTFRGVFRNGTNQTTDNIFNKKSLNHSFLSQALP